MINSILDDGLSRPPRIITDPKEIIRINDLKLEANEQSKKMRYGRYVLYFLAGMGLLVGIGMEYFGDGSSQEEESFLLGGLIMCVLYAGFAGLTFKWPISGLALGLSLYLFDHGLAAVQDPATIANGLALKIAILYGFGLGIQGSVQQRIILRELAGHRIPPGELDLARRLKEMPRTPQVDRA